MTNSSHLCDNSDGDTKTNAREIKCIEMTSVLLHMVEASKRFSGSSIKVPPFHFCMHL